MSFGFAKPLVENTKHMIDKRTFISWWKMTIPVVAGGNKSSGWKYEDSQILLLKHSEIDPARDLYSRFCVRYLYLLITHMIAAAIKKKQVERAGDNIKGLKLSYNT